MPTIHIGQKVIEYDLRRSASATQRRITVTPGQVEVLVLDQDGEEDIAGFLHRKRHWVFDTVREMEQATAARHAIPRLMTGSKIPYRGRKMTLTVRRTDGERAAVTFRNGFIVDLPLWAGRDAEKLVASELRHWLRQRARRNVQEAVRHYRDRFGLIPKSVKIGDLEHGWGACGPGGNVVINWHLIMAPAKILEYVVAHELAHLRYRSHGPEFWNYLVSIFSEAETAKAWLERNQGSLSADFLEPR